jgi:hypothetical protein
MYSFFKNGVAPTDKVLLCETQKATEAGFERDSFVSNTLSWAQTFLKRPKLTKHAVKRYVTDKDRLVASPGTKGKRRKVGGKAVPGTIPSSEQTAMYPEMEKRLADWIRGMRKMGIPVETYMVRAEGETIYKDLYPLKKDPNGKVDFKFSATWRVKFFSRHRFSLRKVTTRGAAARTKEIVEDDIQAYHIGVRVVQMSGARDPQYGYKPEEVWNHDQVPIALASSNSNSVDALGKDVIWDSVTKSSDCKRFCTLNLTVPMVCTAGNYVKPHLIFSGVPQNGDDWHDA